MIVIPRDLVRKFRTIAKKCLAGRPRGPAPVVVCRVRAGTLTLWVRTESAGLRFTMPCDGKDSMLVVPMDVLAAIEGPASDPVEISIDRQLQGTATWTDRGVPHSHAFVALLSGKQHQIPELPDKLASMPADFLHVLHECGKTAARDVGRFVLNHLQIRGRQGRVIATDSKRAIVWGGFSLPFAEDVLVPAIPAFGCCELACEGDVRVGRSAQDFVVVCGSWSVHLPIHTTGKYPDVTQILPKPGVGTSVILDEPAVIELLRVLPALLGAKAENHPVTVDLDQGLTVRARDETTGLVREASTQLSVAGEPIVVAVDRTAIQRAFALECRTIRINPVTRTLAFECPNRIFLVAALDTAAIVPAVDRAHSRPAESPGVSP